MDLLPGNSASISIAVTGPTVSTPFMGYMSKVSVFRKTDNKTKRLIDTIASYNGYGWKMAY